MNTKYYFIYSVNAVTIDGRLDMYGMILDHPELTDTISAVMASGGSLQAVTVAMYDDFGDLISERDITHMYVTRA